MEWLNIHIAKQLRSPEAIGSAPAELGTWVRVLAYCCEQENGGRISGGASWKDRQWQQLCAVTIRELRAADRLIQFDGSDIVVNGYPAEKEAEVQRARRRGQAGAMAKWGARAGRCSSEAQAHAQASARADAEGEREGEGKSAASPPPARQADADPLGMDSTQRAPAPLAKPDWNHWRQTHPRIYVGRSDEDGSVSDWRALFDRAGPEVMDAMYTAILPTIANPRHGVAFKSAAAWIAANTTDTA